jgi:hypothetical protein
LKGCGTVPRRKTSTNKAPRAVPAGTAPGTFGLPWGNRGGPLSPLRRRAPPPLLILPDREELWFHGRFS